MICDGGSETYIMTTISEREPREEGHFNLETVRKEILQFGRRMEDYLNKVEANVESYKFTVEKRADGAELEVEFKALIRPKTKTIHK